MTIYNLNNTRCLSFLTVLLSWGLFFPTFQNILGSSGTGLVNFPIIVFSILFCFSNISIATNYYRNNFAFRFITTILLGYILYFPISTITGMLLSDVNVTTRDLLDFHRPILFSFSFVTLCLLVVGANNRKGIEKILIVFFIIIWVCGFIQFIRAPFSLLALYTKVGNINSGRSSVPFINPYDFGLMMSFFMYWFLVRILFNKKNSLLFFIMATLSVLMTQSRSVLIACVITLAVTLPCILTLVYFNRLIKGKVNKALFKLLSFMLLSLIGLIISYAVIATHFPYLVEGIEMLFEGRRINSLSIRQEQFKTALAYADKNIIVAILGNGPAKSVLEYVESIYTFYIFRFGFLGLFFIFFSIMTVGIISAYNKLKITKDPFYIAAFLWLTSIFIVSAGNNFTEQVRISLFYYFILAMVIAPLTNKVEKNGR